MRDNQLDEPMRLIRSLRAVGDDAPTRAEKLALMRSIRGQSPPQATLLDEALLAELERLREGLEAARRHQHELEKVLAKVTAPPWHVGVFLGSGAAAGRAAAAIVAVGSTRRVVNFGEGIDAASLEIGDDVLLSTEQHLIVARSPYTHIAAGDTAVFDRCVGERHIVIRSRDEEIVVTATDRLRAAAPRAGDLLRWDRNLGLAFDRLERSPGTHLFLDETPTETFADVGGLDAQIAELQRAIHMHYEHADTVRKYGLRRRTAVLLTGPPGTGKTLLARALANWLARLSRAHRSRFMNVKPGSLHSMWYAQSEANYREAFRVAREAGEQDPDVPVVMFFDEVDAIGGARGDSLARVDDRVLTAFLTELDGLEARGNVLVVCATNRRDALDPALLRPGGRLGDIVLEVPRPNRRAAREILARHLPASIPYAAVDGADDQTRTALVDAAIARIYGPNGHGELATLTLRDGRRRPVAPGELVSGAMLANVARRATERACLREVEGGAAGVGLSDVLEGIDVELTTAADALTPGNCRRYIAGLPDDIDVVRVDRVRAPGRRTYRYLSVA